MKEWELERVRLIERLEERLECSLGELDWLIHESMLSVELEDAGEGAARWYGTGLFLALQRAKVGRRN